MNSSINKTFYTCSTESLFLRYKKISKKAVKLASFLQCSVHIFLGHDGCIWKINLRILWNHIIKNLYVKMVNVSTLHLGQEQNIPRHSLKVDLTDLFWKFSECFLFSRVGIGWWTLYNIQHYPHMFVGQIHAFPFQKGLPFPFSLVRNRIYLGTHLKQVLINLLWKLPGYTPFPYRQSRQECEHLANG